MSTEPFSDPNLEKGNQVASGPALFESSCHFIFDSQVFLMKLHTLTSETMLDIFQNNFINTFVFGETLVTIVVLVSNNILSQYI